MTVTNEDALLIAHKFGIAEREIERLASKIHLQKGAWFFRRHMFSVEDLIESEHYDKIYAICEKIGDDVIHWHQSGKLTAEGLETYQKEREGIRRKLNSLNKEIETRLPTIWENFLSIFEGFVVVVMKVLPTVAKIVKTIAAYLDVDPSRLLGTGKKQKLLPKINDESQA